MLSQKVCEYLRWLKESGDFTQQRLSDKTGIPMGTIPKYFTNMDDESAGFETVRKLVTVMGGSLDELAGIRSDPAPDPTGDRSAVIAGLEAHLQEKEAHLSAKRRWMNEDHEHMQSVILYERRRRAHRLRGVLRRPRAVRDPVLFGFFNPFYWMDTEVKIPLPEAGYF